MPRSRKPGAKYRSPEWRGRISSGLRVMHERRRQAATVLPSDLVRWTRRGSVRKELAGLLEVHAGEMADIGNALGGLGTLSPQRQALLRDWCRLGVAVSLVAGRMLSKPDTAEAGELASRLATLATARARILSLVGLDERREELDLPAYIAQRAAAAADGNQSAPTGAQEDVSDE
jgi:hypothetical protein